MAGPEKDVRLRMLLSSILKLQANRALARCAGACLLGLLWVTASLPVTASSRSSLGDYTLTQWDVEDGLPHNLPLAITQDTRGRIWIATWDGVVRFNGQHFRTYDRSNANGAELAGSSFLLAEDDGGILAGTSDGIHRYFAGQWRRIHPQLAGLRIETMRRDSHGCLWVANDNRLLRVRGNTTREAITLGDTQPWINAIQPLAGGRMLVGSDAGLFEVMEGLPLGRPRVDPALTGPVMDILPEADGWILGTQNGAFHWNGRDGLRALWSGGRVNRMVRGPDGSLWLNIQSGPYVVLKPDGQVNRLDPHGIQARVIFRDRDGLIWGGVPQGVFHLSRGAAHSLAGAEGGMRAVLESPDGTIWAGHSGGLRQIRDGQVRELFNRRSGLENASVMALALARDGQGIWAGTYDRGVILVGLDGSVKQQIRTGEGHSSPLVRAIYDAPDGTLWIGSGSQGLLSWRDGILTPVGDQNGLPSRVVQVIHPEADGGMWIGTLSGVAHRAPDGTFTIYKPDAPLPARSVFDFLRDDDGTLWMATDRGLVRQRGGQYMLFGKRQGLPRSKVFRIIDDGQHFWLPSNRGVFRVARNDLEAVGEGRRAQLSVSVVDHSDGMPGSQGNGGSWPAGWRTRDGQLLFPTASGLGQIDSSRVAGRLTGRVPVEIERVLVDGDEPPDMDNLRLTPDARRITFLYTGLSFQVPERVRYRYRLVGFDADWNEGNASGQAVFTNLPAGSYRFEVEAMNLPVDWSDRERVGSRSLDLQVASPLWQHPAVVISAIGSVLVAMYALMWLRTTSYRRRQRDLNRIIDERTDELIEKNLALEAAGQERDLLMQQLTHQATHDALTELPNRRAADERLHEAVDAVLQAYHPLAVALVDLDHFKRINDTYGHEAGDHVLRQVASRLRSFMGADVFAARHGGEEFLVVIEGWQASQVRQWLDTLRRSLVDSPVILPDGMPLACAISCGVAFFGEDGQTVRTLLAAADARLYEAKRTGRNRVVG